MAVNSFYILIADAGMLIFNGNNLKKKIISNPLCCKLSPFYLYKSNHIKKVFKPDLLLWWMDSHLALNTGNEVIMQYLSLNDFKSNLLLTIIIIALPQCLTEL